MVVKTTEDGVVQLYLNGELKLEQAAVSNVTIGSKSEWVEVDGEWIESKSAGDYDMAFVGKDASLTYADVSDDGSVLVDIGGKTRKSSPPRLKSPPVVLYYSKN